MSNFPTRNCPDCGAPYQVGASTCERGHALPPPDAAVRKPAWNPSPRRSRSGGVGEFFRTMRQIKAGCILIVLLVFGIGYVANCVIQDFLPDNGDAENVGAPDSSAVSSPPTSTPTSEDWRSILVPSPSSPRAAPTSERLPTVTGASTYQTDDEIRVEWIVPPTISRDGRLRLKVRVLDESLTLYPDGASDGNGLDVNIVGPSRGGRFPLPRAMYGEILPPARPGYNWGDLDETEFIADVFDFNFRTRTLTLEVLTNPRLAGAEEIYASLWTNPPRGETPTWVNRERVRLAPN